MVEFSHIVAIAASMTLVLVLLLVFFYRSGCCKKREQFVEKSNSETDSLEAGIARLHQAALRHQFEIDGKRRGNYYVFRKGVSAKPMFNWSDYPGLVTEAVENGWSRFAFTSTGYMSSPPSTRSALLGLCAVGGESEGGDAEIGWEICQGSAEYMQTIRLNCGLKNVINISSPSITAASVIRTALPLPGPPLGSSSFPQEAYFEITLMHTCDDVRESSIGKVGESDRIKLISETNGKVNSESLVHVSSGNGINKIEELKVGERVMLSVGLTEGGSLPFKLPGSYYGSIGFNSNGTVYLDGIKLVFESEKAEWGRTDKVIGCGYDPRQKKVFFTVDSELVHVIHCKSEEFGTPLYPTLAANSDIRVVVNLGQSMFKYGPANEQRTPNPCFFGPTGNSQAAMLGYEDSRELFSMGRMDAQWLASKDSHHSHIEEFDEESEADLFEIALDCNGRSPHTVL